jgi:hypothetical protein
MAIQVDKLTADQEQYLSLSVRRHITRNLGLKACYISEGTARR